MTDLETLRAEVDVADLELTAALLRRFEIVAKIADLKRRELRPFADAAREATVLARVGAAIGAAAGSPLVAERTTLAFRLVLQVSREMVGAVVLGDAPA